MYGQCRVYFRLPVAYAQAPLCVLTAIVLAVLAPSPLLQTASARPAGHGAGRVAPYYGHTFAIGDSVMLDAQGELQRRGVTVDAVVGRQFFQGVGILQWMQSARQLPGAVVVGLGTNGPISDVLFDQMMGVLRGARVVVFVTVKEPRYWESEVNGVLRAGVARWPRTELADWHGLSENHPEWFWGDGIHMRAEGSAPYARLVAAALSRGWSEARQVATRTRRR